jgi:hypothetical protein
MMDDPLVNEWNWRRLVLGNRHSNDKIANLLVRLREEEMDIELFLCPCFTIPSLIHMCHTAGFTLMDAFYFEQKRRRLMPPRDPQAQRAFDLVRHFLSNEPLSVTSLHDQARQPQFNPELVYFWLVANGLSVVDLLDAEAHHVLLSKMVAELGLTTEHFTLLLDRRRILLDNIPSPFVRG